MLWALVDDSVDPNYNVYIYIAFTGAAIPDSVVEKGWHISTIQKRGFIFHIFIV